MISEGASRIIIKSDPYSDPYLEGDGLEFRLTYEGPLLSDSKRSDAVRRTRADNKQEIRKVFHGQLKQLWRVKSALATASAPRPKPGVAVFGRLKFSPQELADNFNMFGYRFVPLATQELSVFCSINVLLLRPQSIGGVIKSTGDIDNGFKVVFDALSMPRSAAQLGKFSKPGEGENPFYCLLEDDQLITKASVESDLMLEPLHGSNGLNATDARVIVQVKLVPMKLTAHNAGFA